MKFAAFRKRMQALATDSDMEMTCHNDTERGRFCARFSDGTTITARPDSYKITVRYGSGHQMMAEMKGGKFCAA